VAVADADGHRILREILMQNEKIVVDERDANSWPTVLEPNTNPGTILGLAPPPSVPPASGTPHGPRDLAGTELLARYEVEEVIGSGGMATVYRGRHKAIQKPVAIKVLDDGLEWRLDAAERFLQEAQVTSRVIHENVVEVTDFGTTADRVVFCVMELLQGESLADVIARTGAMSLPRAAEIMRQICSALEAAHGHGIIHRDLKPANVFCTPRPSNPDFVKVLDFGIARVAHDGDGPHDPEAARPMPTITGYIIGTPDYMAPEQACEQPLDHRVDVYAAGGVFFELLTGRKPYLGRSTAELLAAHLHLPVPDPGELDPSLPQAVRDVVRKAMAKDPDDRYASMREMSEAIADAVCAEDMLAIVRGPRRRMAIAAFAVGVLGLGGWLVSDPPSPPEDADDGGAAGDRGARAGGADRLADARRAAGDRDCGTARRRSSGRRRDAERAAQCRAEARAQAGRSRARRAAGGDAGGTTGARGDGTDRRLRAAALEDQRGEGSVRE
jgi:tRNA A-37 threonylcarbamoyl transferase component Bud32